MRNIAERVHGVVRHPLARGSAVVFIGSTLANVGSYAYHLVVGRMLGPESYGELASLFSFSYLLNVPSLVLQTVLARYFAGFHMGKETGKAKALSITVLKSLTAISLAGAVLTVPFVGVLAEFLHIRDEVSVFYMYLTSALWLLTVVQSSMLQGFQMFTQAMILSNVAAGLRLIGGYAGAAFGVMETVLAGLITGVVGFASYFVPLLSVYRSKSVETGITGREVVSYSLPSLVTMLGITSLYSTDIMLAKHFLPAVDAGYYSALSVLGKIIFFASSSVSYVLFPVVVQRTKQKADSERLVYAALLAVALVSAGITAGYAMFPETALHLLFGPSYNPAAAHLSWFGIFITLYSLCYVTVMTLLGRGNTRVWTLVGGAAVCQIAAIWLFHDSIYTILVTNISVTAGLLVSLLLYYRHEVKRH